MKISFTPLANKWLRDTIQRMKKGPALYLGIGTIIALGGLFSYADAQSTTACSFSRNLYEGLIGSDVQCLQSYLNSHGFELASAGPGSPGNETDHFGPLMQNVDGCENPGESGGREWRTDVEGGSAFDGG